MKIIIDNLATEYSDNGKGKTLLLLHGWMDSLHTFDAILPLLQESFRIVRLDMPGFGQTETPKEAWDVSDYTRFVTHFLEKKKINPDYILGHSFGGRVTIKGVANGSLKPTKIVLVGSAGLAKRMSPRNLLVMFAAKVFGLLTLIPPFLFYRDKLRQKAYQLIGSDYLGAGVLKDTYLRVISEDLSRDAGSIKLPTKLIWGSQDTETPLSQGKKFNEIITASDLSVLDDSGHMVHQQKPAEVAALVKEFLT